MLAGMQAGGRKGAIPLGLCALAGAPSLAAALRRLLQNDSLLDIGQRRALYMELSLLLRKLGPQPFICLLHQSSSDALHGLSHRSSVCGLAIAHHHIIMHA
jgi:hypothetical protein